MRFATKFDRWLMVALMAGAGVSLGVPLAGWLAGNLDRAISARAQRAARISRSS